MQDRYLFPFSSSITLVDPNYIDDSHGDTSSARFELLVKRPSYLRSTLFSQ